MWNHHLCHIHLHHHNYQYRWHKWRSYLLGFTSHHDHHHRNQRCCSIGWREWSCYHHRCRRAGMQIAAQWEHQPPSTTPTYIWFLEVIELLVNYQDYLLFYRRYIDGGIGCWDCSRPDSQFKFNKFLTILNQFGKLRWTNTGFVLSLEFMDLTISIKNHTLHFKTFQKEHCLYLYIPPLSAHVQEMIRGLIFASVVYTHTTNTTPTSPTTSTWATY